VDVFVGSRIIKDVTDALFAAFTEDDQDPTPHPADDQYQRKRPVDPRAKGQ
jgi:hypothetical protein